MSASGAQQRFFGQKNRAPATMSVPAGRQCRFGRLSLIMPLDDLDRRLRGPWRDYGLIAVPAWYRPPRPPTKKTPAEMGYLRVYITYSELFGTEPSWDDFFSRLRGIGLRPVMAALSYLNTLLKVKGTLQAQDETVGGTFDADLMSRVAKLPEWRGRVVYSPPQALLVMKTALLYSPDRDDERDDRAFTRALAEVMLMANDLIDADARPAIAAAKNQDELVRAFLPFTIRATLAQHSEGYVIAIGRAAILFTKLAVRADLRRSPNFVDLDTRVRSVTGLSVLDYFAVGLSVVLWFFSGANRRELTDNRQLRAATFFSQSKLDPAVGARFLEGLTHTYPSAKTAFEKRSTGGRLFSYDFVPFMLRPLFQILEGVTVPVSLAFLESRVTNGVYWLIFDSMPSAERERLSAFYGQVLEAYVRDVLVRTLPDGGDLSQRVFGEFTYRTGKGEQKTTDVVALYPGAAIFFEVTATRLRMEDTLLSGDPAAVEADLENIIIRKARQLHDRIADFRAGRYSFGGATANEVKQILPVVVTGASLPIWTVTMKVVNRSLQANGWLQGPGIEPLRIIGVDELEMIEPLVARGENLLAILQKHAADPELRNVSLHNYLTTRYKVQVNETLRAAFAEVGNHAAWLLFDKDLRDMGAPSHETIRARAYESWEKRGRSHGHDLDDWLQAQHELQTASLAEALRDQ